MQVINTNVMSLNAQRNLSKTGSELAQSIQRLSSGLRINSAKDDAAGLAISDRFTTQIRGLNQAVRNANDGISLAQTAEGALNQVNDNLQRIRELAVQAANATNSDTDRAALQSEVEQLADEIDRVANQTSFNGTKLLDGSFTGTLFQTGANAGETIGINNITDANIDKLGGVTFLQDETGNTVTAAASTALADFTVSVTDGDGNVTTQTVSGFELSSDSLTAAETAGEVAAAINSVLGESGVYAKATAGSADLTFVSLKDNEDVASYTISDITEDSAAGTTLLSTLTGSTDATASTTVGDVNVSTFEGSGQAISVVDQALSDVNTARAELGAIQNRFESTIANLQTTSENLSASRSRILDTDFAAETAALTRAQILQQAGTAMLAQANAIPQNVLSLLQ